MRSILLDLCIHLCCYFSYVATSCDFDRYANSTVRPCIAWNLTDASDGCTGFKKTPLIRSFTNKCKSHKVRSRPIPGKTLYLVTIVTLTLIQLVLNKFVLLNSLSCDKPGFFIDMFECVDCVCVCITCYRVDLLWGDKNIVYMQPLCRCNIQYLSVQI